MSDKQVRAQYTREFKLEAVRQVRAGQAIAVVAKVLGIPKASLLRSIERNYTHELLLIALSASLSQPCSGPIPSPSLAQNSFRKRDGSPPSSSGIGVTGVRRTDWRTWSTIRP